MSVDISHSHTKVEFLAISAHRYHPLAGTVNKTKMKQLNAYPTYIKARRRIIVHVKTKEMNIHTLDYSSQYFIDYKATVIIRQNLF